MGRVAHAYRRATYAPSRWAVAAFANAMAYAQRAARNGAELAHLDIVRSIIAKRHADAELQRIVESDRRQQQLLLFVTNERPMARAFAALEIQNGLTTVENTLGVVRLLIDRQDAQITRLEEGTLAMEAHIEASERALTRTRRRSSVGSLVARLAAIGVAALLVLLLLV